MTEFRLDLIGIVGLGFSSFSPPCWDFDGFIPFAKEGTNDAQGVLWAPESMSKIVVFESMVMFAKSDMSCLPKTLNP